jgi:general secretion pathway protein G
MYERLRKLQEARKDAKGFTLIELLIVIVILGVLAGIVVFSVSGIQNKGQVAACQTDVKTVAVAEEAYYAQNGNYGTTTAILKGAGLMNSAPTDVAITITAGPPASVAVKGATDSVCPTFTG